MVLSFNLPIVSLCVHDGFSTFIAKEEKTVMTNVLPLVSDACASEGKYDLEVA